MPMLQGSALRSATAVQLLGRAGVCASGVWQSGRARQDCGVMSALGGGRESKASVSHGCSLPFVLLSTRVHACIYRYLAAHHVHDSCVHQAPVCPA